MTIFCSGCFDVLHVGHINILLFCRQQAGDDGKVIISLDSDGKIRKDKGDNRPIFSFEERKEAIEALRLNNRKVIDLVTEHLNNDYLLEEIRLYKPDLLVVGSDYADKDVVGEDETDVAYYPRDYRFSSSNIIGRIIHKE